MFIVPAIPHTGAMVGQADAMVGQADAMVARSRRRCWKSAVVTNATR
jgi:hypothetical protein